MVTAEFKIQAEVANFRRSKMTKKSYFRTDKKSLDMFADEMELRLKTGGVESFEELNKIMNEVADSILKAVYQRKWNERQKVKEQPWISSQIREEIKKRRELNCRKRNGESVMGERRAGERIH